MSWVKWWKKKIRSQTNISPPFFKYLGGIWRNRSIISPRKRGWNSTSSSHRTFPFLIITYLYLVPFWARLALRMDWPVKCISLLLSFSLALLWNYRKIKNVQKKISKVHYIAGSARGQYEANLVFWSATRVGKMGQSCLHGITRLDPAQEKHCVERTYKAYNFWT